MRRSPDGSAVARRRFALPVLWQMAIVVIVAFLYTMAVVSITASAVAARLEPTGAPAHGVEQWHPPLKWPPMPDDSWLYRPGAS